MTDHGEVHLHQLLWPGLHQLTGEPLASLPLLLQRSAADRSRLPAAGGFAAPVEAQALGAHKKVPIPAPGTFHQLQFMPRWRPAGLAPDTKRLHPLSARHSIGTEDHPGPIRGAAYLCRHATALSVSRSRWLLCKASAMLTAEKHLRAPTDGTAGGVAPVVAQPA